MRQRLWLGASLLIAMTFLAVGCAEKPVAHPEGMESLRPLTSNEIATVIETAYNDSEVRAKLQGASDYAVLNWIAIDWENHAEWWLLDYHELVEKGIPQSVPESAAIYPEVVIHSGEPERWKIMVVVDLETETVVLIEENPDISAHFY